MPRGQAVADAFPTWTDTASSWTIGLPSLPRAPWPGTAKAGGDPRARRHRCGRGPRHRGHIHRRRRYLAHPAAGVLFL